jgi:hypothetical protein
VTDTGYIDEPRVVWERLGEIDGDSEFFTHRFTPARDELKKMNTPMALQEHRIIESTNTATSTSLPSSFVSKDQRSRQDYHPTFPNRNEDDDDKKGACTDATPRSVTSAAAATVGVHHDMARSSHDKTHQLSWSKYVFYMWQYGQNHTQI